MRFNPQPGTAVRRSGLTAWCHCHVGIFRLGALLAGGIGAACCLLPPARGSDQVVPLVIPGVVPQHGGGLDDRLDTRAPLTGLGFPGLIDPELERGTESESDLDFLDGPGMAPGAAPLSQALVIPAMPGSGEPADDEGDDLVMGFGEFEEGQVAASPESGEAPNALATSGLFGRQPGAAPTIGDTWLSGYDSFPTSAFRGAGLVRDLRQGLAFSVNLVGAFESNASQGLGGGGEDGGDDYFVLLGGGVSYLSRASTWTYGFNYSGGYRQYFTQDDLSGAYHSGGASINYSGGPLTASLGLGVNFGSGANRNYQSVTDSISYSYSLSARYKYSEKTTVAGNLSQNFSTATGAGNLDVGSFDSGLSVLWKYSPLTEFGPGVRYTRRAQGDGPTQTSVGPMLSLNHELTGKVSLNSRVGLDFTGLEGEGFEVTSWSTAVGVNYRASPLWGANLSVLRDSQASFSTSGQFEDIWAVRLGYNRKILRASWNLGLGYENRSAENEAAGGGRDYFTVDTSIGMLVFGNSTSASIFASYRDESGGDRSWGSFQFGIGLSRSF